MIIQLFNQSVFPPFLQELKEEASNIVNNNSPSDPKQFSMITDNNYKILNISTDLGNHKIADAADAIVSSRDHNIPPIDTLTPNNLSLDLDCQKR